VLDRIVSLNDTIPAHQSRCQEQTVNKLKARTKDGKTVLLSVSQNPPAHGRLPLRWNSPKAVKAKALDMGLTLIGKRQVSA